jgi:hypothetical protein
MVTTTIELTKEELQRLYDVFVHRNLLGDDPDIVAKLVEGLKNFESTDECHYGNHGKEK